MRKLLHHQAVKQHPNGQQLKKRKLVAALEMQKVNKGAQTVNSWRMLETGLIQRALLVFLETLEKEGSMQVGNQLVTGIHPQKGRRYGSNIVLKSESMSKFLEFS